MLPRSTPRRPPILAKSCSPSPRVGRSGREDGSPQLGRKRPTTPNEYLTPRIILEQVADISSESSKEIMTRFSTLLSMDGAEKSCVLLRDFVGKLNNCQSSRSSSVPTTLPDSLIPDKYHVRRCAGDPSPSTSNAKYEDDVNRKENIFPTLNPSSRREANHLYKCFERMIEDIPKPLYEHFDESLLVVSICFTEFLRQISSQCLERGQTLGRLWEFFTKLYREKYAEIDRITKGRIKEGKFICDCLQKTENLQKRLDDERLEFENKLSSLSEDLRMCNYDLKITKQELANTKLEYEKFRSQVLTDNEQKTHYTSKLEDFMSTIDIYSSCFTKSSKPTPSTLEDKWERNISAIVDFATRETLEKSVQAEEPYFDIFKLHVTAHAGVQTNPIDSVDTSGPSSSKISAKESEIKKLTKEVASSSDVAVRSARVIADTGATQGFGPKIEARSTNITATDGAEVDVLLLRQRTKTPRPIHSTTPETGSRLSPTEKSPPLKPGTSNKKSLKKSSKKFSPPPGSKLWMRVVTFENLSRGQEKSLPKSQLYKIIAQIYAEKITADQLDDKEFRSRQSLPEFIHISLLHKYGMQEIAEKHLCELLESVYENGGERRVRMFGRFCGLFDPFPISYLNIYLSCLGKAAMVSSSIHMEDRETGLILILTQRTLDLLPTLSSRVSGSRLLRLKEDITSKSFPLRNTQESILVHLPEIRSIIQDSHSSLLSGTPKIDTSVKVIEFDLFMEMVFSYMRMDYGDEKRYLEKLFLAGDFDSDNHLGFTEFMSVARFVNPYLTPSQLSGLYDGDPSSLEYKINNDKFIVIAKAHNFYQSWTPLPKPDGVPDTPYNIVRCIEEAWSNTKGLFDREVQQLEDLTYPEYRKWVTSLCSRRVVFEQVLSSRTDPEKIWLMYKVLTSEILLCRKIRLSQTRQDRISSSKFVEVKELLPPVL